MSDPENIEFIIIEPGKLQLPTTQITIQFDKDFFNYKLYWQDKHVPAAIHGNLSDAKDAARKLMRELIDMGFEP